jgi:hypothetical protein
MRSLPIAALLGVAAPAMLHAQPATQAEMTLDEVATRGELIYRYDQAAAITTDEMLRILKGPVPIKGWVVEADGDSLRVTYYGLDGDKPYAIFKASVGDKKVVFTHLLTENEDRTLSATARQMVRAELAAKALALKPCIDARFNPVVLPPTTDGTIMVYLLTPQVETGTYPVGGHYRVQVDAAGKVVTSRPFLNSCLTIPTPPVNAKAFLLTHLLDPQPTEIHVYLSLLMGKPIAVSTSDGSWMVEGSHIRRFQPR